MTSAQIRQSFLDFFKSKGHTIVPSASLMPDSPGLLFTNAGMNQFVPIFLNQRAPDVDQWPGALPGRPTRAADTQKCIRAGGKHNDLEDVGLDTYHHTFFEMLGNWSFGDYFKQEAIEWAWELVVEKWRFPAQRLYATVYNPDKSKGDPSDFDQEAYDFWAAKFTAAGLNPKVHIVHGNKKDNFWMMGETGPCGPCSELHVDLTPAGDTQGSLVNKGDARCIEIWNLVFIQFNANPDGTFSPLPARHVDTGMGFERVTGIMQNTGNFTDFTRVISNYETDIFRPLFDALEKLSAKKYAGTLPTPVGGTGDSPVAAGNLPAAPQTAGQVARQNGPVARSTPEQIPPAGSTGDSPVAAGNLPAAPQTAGQVARQNGPVARSTPEQIPPAGSTGDPPVAAGNLPAAPPTAGQLARQNGPVARSTPRPSGAIYSKRNLPHFEKPWAIYHVIIRTVASRNLSPAARDLVLDCILHWRELRFRLVAACVMPDHAHFIIQPGVKEEDKEGNPVFWPLSEILHSIKSFSAKQVNKLDNLTGVLWQDERYDRYMRGDADLQEKFHYLCRNPWTAGLVQETEPWPWLWTPNMAGGTGDSPVAAGNLPAASQAAVPFARRDGPVARSTPEQIPPTGSTGDSPVAAGNLPAASQAAVPFARQDGPVARSTPEQIPPTGSTGGSPVAAGNLPAASQTAGQVARQDGPVARSTQEQIQTDIAFRVIADHIRTLSFSIADGILPGNNDRNYVLRRILRRAVRYGRTLGFHEPFFYKLVEVLAETMGDVFPELRKKQSHVQEVIKAEEEGFNKTLDSGTLVFEEVVGFCNQVQNSVKEVSKVLDRSKAGKEYDYKGEVGGMWKSIWQLMEPAQKFGSLPQRLFVSRAITVSSALDLGRLIPPISATVPNAVPLAETLRELEAAVVTLEKCGMVLPGEATFLLYDTYGFPLDLTELMARERGFTVDTVRFHVLMEEARALSRAAQKKEIIAASNLDTSHPTDFVGFDRLTAPATVLAAVNIKDKTAVTLDASPLYAEMGGQVGDTGEIHAGGKIWPIVNTQKTGNTFLHFVAGPDTPEPGAKVELRVNALRRAAIQRHHTVTHLLHWALHEVVSHDATQKGSYVGPDKLTFDYSSAPLTPAQVADVEKLVNERILDNAGVTWTEVPYAQIKSRKEVMQFFGEKYGDVVRVVQIGGRAGSLDGYSMELCGGTHTRATGEIGLFRILSESAIAAGIRRIEAVAGLRAYEKARDDTTLISTLAGKVNSPVAELEKKLESLLSQQKDMEKQLKAARQKQAAETARALLKSAPSTPSTTSTPAIIENLGAADSDFLQAVADALKSQFKGVVVLGGTSEGAVSLVATVSPDATAKFQAGKIIQAIAPLVGGKGGGRPDNARGGGKDAAKLPDALNKARELVAGSGGA